MFSTKQVIKALKGVFTIAWYVNVVLAGSALVFQVINLILKKKMLMASFMGGFKVESKSVGQLELVQEHLNVYVDSFMADPSLLIENTWSQYLILFYSIAVLAIVLVYNYQFKQLFVEMNQSISDAELFKLASIKRFNWLSLFSLIVFVVGSTVSLLKVFLIKELKFGGMVFKPVFDNQIFNMLWLSIAFYLVAVIFRAGLDLKQESELTI